jgi:hypothetical protein
MKLEFSLSCTQKTATDPYPELFEFRSHPNKSLKTKLILFYYLKEIHICHFMLQITLNVYGNLLFDLFIIYRTEYKCVLKPSK